MKRWRVIIAITALAAGAAAGWLAAGAWGERKCGNVELWNCGNMKTANDGSAGTTKGGARSTATAAIYPESDCTSLAKDSDVRRQ